MRDCGDVPGPGPSRSVVLVGAGWRSDDVRDIGDVCAQVLLDPQWASQTLVLTGARAVTFGEIAAMVSQIRGDAVSTLEITPADVRDNLLGRGMASWEAEHLQEMYQLFRDGQSEFVTGDVERVLGRAPRTVEDYLHEIRDDLVQTDSAATR